MDYNSNIFALAQTCNLTNAAPRGDKPVKNAIAPDLMIVTTIAGAKAKAKAIESRKNKPLTVRALQDYF